MKHVLIILALLFLPLFTAGKSLADTIQLKRGFPTDTWVTWPEIDGLKADSVTAVFPEYRKFVQASDFVAAKQAGFDFVRLGVDPVVFLLDRSPARTEKLLAGVRLAVDEVLAAGLKVDLDMHTVPREHGSPGTEQIVQDDKNFTDYLTVIADVGRVVASYPKDKVAWEVLNEPTLDCAWDRKKGDALRWPKMLVDLHVAARKVAPEHTLILSGACWGGAEGLAEIDPKSVADDNVLWSFHSYDPFVFSHQGATWTGNFVAYLKDVRFPPDAKDKKIVLSNVLKSIKTSKASKEQKAAWIDEATSDLNDYYTPGRAEQHAKESMVLVDTWTKKHGVPSSRIFIGEFGAMRTEKDSDEKKADRLRFYKLLRTEAEKRGFTWSLWQWSGVMGISKDFDGRSFDPAMLAALGLK
jgi:endoglucanase